MPVTVIASNGNPNTIKWRNNPEQIKQREAKAKRRAAETKRIVLAQQTEAKRKKAARDSMILKTRNKINADHTLTKKYLQIECQRRTSILKTKFQKRMLDYDVSLRQRLNTIPANMSSKQRIQAESRFKADSLRLKRALNYDNKHRQLIIQRECSDKAKRLDRNLKLRIEDFQRTLAK